MAGIEARRIDLTPEQRENLWTGQAQLARWQGRRAIEILRQEERALEARRERIRWAVLRTGFLPVAFIGGAEFAKGILTLSWPAMLFGVIVVVCLELFTREEKS